MSIALALHVICGVISAAICLRIFAQPHQDHSNHNYVYAFLSWLLMISTGGVSIHALLTRGHIISSVFEAILLSLLAIIVFRAKGSPALLFGARQ